MVLAEKAKTVTVSNSKKLTNEIRFI
jgi:hypothetical protein